MLDRNTESELFIDFINLLNIISLSVLLYMGIVH